MFGQLGSSMQSAAAMTLVIASILSEKGLKEYGDSG